jgi:hypothetical protein
MRAYAMLNGYAVIDEALRKRTAMYHTTSKDEQNLYRCRTLYSVEIARHTSAILSGLSHESRTKEIDYTVATFVRGYGRKDLRYFLMLVVDRLEARGHADAAHQVCDLIRREYGMAAIRREPVEETETRVILSVGIRR